MWAIHSETVIVVYVSLDLFDDLHHDLFADDGAFDSHRLLEGHDNTSLQLGRALWDLSRKAVASDEVRKIIQENAPGDVMEALGASSGGTQFRQELEGVLDAYGQRGSLWGICHTSWLEDPSPVIVNVKDYLDRDEEPTGQLDERAAEREEAVATVRQRLEGYPAAVRDEFEGLLKAAAAAVVLTEDHGFWIDFRACYDIRMVVVELGRRLETSGAIETALDIFFLSKAEISAAAASAPDHADAVRQRKSELEHFNSLNPPLFMGTDYGPPPRAWLPPPSASSSECHRHPATRPTSSTATPAPLEKSRARPGSSAPSTTLTD